MSLLLGAGAIAEGGSSKFRPATKIDPVTGRYVVSLDSSVPDAAGAAEALARTYLGQLEPYQSSESTTFAIRMLPSRARSLSADPRVIEVVEIPQPDDRLSPSSAATAASRHLIAHPLSSSGTYAYDGSGNIKEIGADSFIYDAEGRLTDATVLGNRQTYTYDIYGNRLTATRAQGAIGCLGNTTCEAAVTMSETPSATNHLANVTYDDAGNVTQGYDATYVYDGTGMVTKATVGSDVRNFAYTADDERIAVKQGVSWTWMVRDQGGKVLREFTSLETTPFALTNHTWSKDYVWRDGLLLASISIPPGSSSPVTYHYHLDHLGTPRMITTDGGIVVGNHSYYPFGAEMNLTPQESSAEAMKFTGHERDTAAGSNHSVDYMHARYYNANLGRFLSVDPNVDVEQNLPEPQRWNRYAYATNNPLRYMDADGKERLQAYHFHRQPVPYQGFKQELIAVAKPAAFMAALMFGPEIAATAVTAFLSNPAGVTNAIGNALTPGPGGEMPGVSNPISGDFERVISTKGGDVSVLADASTKGTVLTLSGISIYGTDKSIKAGEAGAGVFKAAITSLATEAKAHGYTQIILQGLRYSGATKDTDKAVRDILINLVEKAQ